MEHSEDNHEVAPAEILANKGETQPIDAQVQPNSRGTHVVYAELHPSVGDTEQIDAKVKPMQGESPPVDTEIYPNNAEPQPLDSGFHPSNEEPQPLNIQTQPESGEPQSMFAEMQPNFVISHPLAEESKQNDGDLQLMDIEFKSNYDDMQGHAKMHPHHGELQSFSADMKPSNAEMQLINAEIQSNNGGIQQYVAEAHLNNGDIQPYHGELQPLDTDTQPENAEMQPNNRKRKRSMVWEYFTIENVSPECRRASCNQCKQSFAYSMGSKVAGTSHLKRHIAKGTCAALLKSQEKNQKSPKPPAMTQSGSVSGAQKRRYRSSSTLCMTFDQDRCRQEIAKMITMHDYPLDMVEHPGFVSFVKSLQPNCDLGNFNIVQGDCIATYLNEKQNLMRTIEATPGRLCLSLDLWTSNQTVGYFILTGHFLDRNWKPCKRVLNVVSEPYPDSETALSHAISVCISDWKLENKLLSITVSHPSSEVVLRRLRAYLAVKNPLVLNGQLLIQKCISHTLSNMAQIVLGAGQAIVVKIRESVKYVKASESSEEKFLDLKQQLQVPSEKSLSLDDQTRWNTTYEMLVAASELREVFSCLDASDPDYKKTPSIEVWKEVETLCTYLKLLYDGANILAKTSNPTIVTCFHEVWKIHSDLGRAVLSEDPLVASLVKPMHEKINEYWKDCSLILAVAVVLDPRFKMKLVEFTFSKFYGEEAPVHVSIVDEGIRGLFNEYAAHPLSLTCTAEEGNTGSNVRTNENGEVHLTDHGLSDFDVYIMETTGQQIKSELDQYLEETLLPRVQEIDVLNWWKLNNIKYPTLSKMARDILTIPVCSLPPNSVFDKAPKEMDGYRSSLGAGTAEALICSKDWLQYRQSEASNQPVKMAM